MQRSELVDELYTSSAVSHNTVSKAVDCILQTLIESLTSGQRIEIRGFGSFKVKESPPRLARNPKTGESVQTRPKAKVAFKPSTLLNQRLNKKIVNLL